MSEEDLESDVVFWIDAGEFLVSFLIVFTVFRTAVNEDGEHRSLGMDEFVLLVAETCVTSYLVTVKSLDRVLMH